MKKQLCENLDILCADIVSWLGPSYDFSAAVFGSNLYDFTLTHSESSREQYTIAPIEFLECESQPERSLELLLRCLLNILPSVPKTLKPVPLLVVTEHPIQRGEVQNWLTEHSLSDQVKIAAVECLEHQKMNNEKASFEDTEAHGVQEFVFDSIAKYVAMQNVLLTVCLGSSFSESEETQQGWLSSTNPWGSIPSEGAAAALFVTPVVTSNLCLEPIARLDSVTFFGSNERRHIRRYMAGLRQSKAPINKLATHLSASREDNEEIMQNLLIEKAHYPEVTSVVNSYRMLGDIGIANNLASIVNLVLEHRNNHEHRLDGLAYLFGSDRDRVIARVSTR